MKVKEITSITSYNTGVWLVNAETEEMIGANFNLIKMHEDWDVALIESRTRVIHGNNSLFGASETTVKATLVLFIKRPEEIEE